MTEEQLIQEYSDAVYPKIAKALISETKKMLIEKAWQIIVTEFYTNKRLDKDVFIKAMEK